MVTKEIILKTFETIIVNKCKKPSYSLIKNLNNQIKHTMNQFANDTRSLDYERGIIIGGNGEIIIDTTDNKNASVFIGEKDYLYDKITEEYCKDILEDYHKENDKLIQNPKADYDDFDKLDKKYSELINKRLNDLGESIQVNVDHNHPGAFGNKDERGNVKSIPLDYNVFTCLSPSDIRSVRVGVDVNGFYCHNLVKSISAECSNGSRMTLVNNNPIGQQMDYDKFDNASDNLQKVWGDYLGQINTMGEEYIKTFPQKYSNYKGDDLNQVTHDDLNNYLKKQSQELFPSMLKDVIKDFEDANIELRIDWL